MNQEWENRVLCSDGNCIGVVGSDGRCKECGKPYEGKLPAGFGTQPSTEKSEPTRQPESETDTTPEPPPRQPGGGDRSAGDDEWENRVLCSDGNCIGVIGSDGRCKECGKPSSAESSD